MRHWSPLELARFIEAYAETPDYELSRMFDRPIRGIQYKARKCGLVKNEGVANEKDTKPKRWIEKIDEDNLSFIKEFGDKLELSELRWATGLDTETLTHVLFELGMW